MRAAAAAAVRLSFSPAPSLSLHSHFDSVGVFYNFSARNADMQVDYISPPPSAVSAADPPAPW